MPAPRLVTDRLELTPLPARAAAALPERREEVSRAVGAELSSEWPAPDLLGVLRLHANASRETECFGVWVMIESEEARIVGDVGFHGPPDGNGTVEIGYSVVPSRRGRGYAAEAAGALVAWALSQPSVRAVVAGCDLDNVASARTLERAGFSRTGEEKGEARWRYRGDG